MHHGLSCSMLECKRFACVVCKGSLALDSDPEFGFSVFLAFRVRSVQVCVLLDVVVERLRTVDAAVRSTHFLVHCVGIRRALSRNRAIIKVLHHYHQFTMKKVSWGFRLVLLGYRREAGADELA